MERHQVVAAEDGPGPDAGQLPTEPRVLRGDHGVGGEQDGLRVRADIAFHRDDERLAEPPGCQDLAGPIPRFAVDGLLLAAEELFRYFTGVGPSRKALALRGQQDALDAVLGV